MKMEMEGEGDEWRRRWMGKEMGMKMEIKMDGEDGWRRRRMENEKEMGMKMKIEMDGEGDGDEDGDVDGDGDARDLEELQLLLQAPEEGVFEHALCRRPLLGLHAQHLQYQICGHYAFCTQQREMTTISNHAEDASRLP